MVSVQILDISAQRQNRCHHPFKKRVTAEYVRMKSSDMPGHSQLPHIPGNLYSMVPITTTSSCKSSHAAPLNALAEISGSFFGNRISLYFVPQKASA